MKMTVDRQIFHDQFKAFDRMENFSHAGRNALFDWLEEYERSCDQEIEFDVIALCCEYNEEEISQVLKDNNLDSLEDLHDMTDVIWHNDKYVLYQAY